MDLLTTKMTTIIKYYSLLYVAYMEIVNFRYNSPPNLPVRNRLLNQ